MSGWVCDETRVSVVAPCKPHSVLTSQLSTTWSTPWKFESWVFGQGLCRAAAMVSKPCEDVKIAPEFTICLRWKMPVRFLP